MSTDDTRNIGFLGPEFLGLGLIRELPAEEREPFRQWLVAQNIEHNDHYPQRSYFRWCMVRAFERLNRESNSAPRGT
jgi:hypothetical protein